MYKALYWTEKQQQSPNMGFVPKIEEVYNVVLDDEKKKFDVLSKRCSGKNI